MIRKAINTAGAPWLTSALLSVHAAVYVYMAWLSDAPFGPWVDLLFKNPAGIALFIALALNVAASAARLVMRHLEPPPTDIDAVRAMPLVMHIDAISPEELGGWIERRGIKPLRQGNALTGAKGVHSWLPGVVLRVGIVALMAALMLSMNARQEQKVTLFKGVEANALGRTLTLRDVAAELPSSFLQVGDSNTFRLETLEAAIDIDGQIATVTPGMPLKRSGLYYRVLHTGYARELSWLGHSETVALDVLPPGRQQTLRVPGQNIVLTIELEPMSTMKKGLLKGQTFNLAEPVFRIAARGERGQDSAAIAQSGDLMNSLMELGDAGGLYATILVARDPAYPLLWAGLWTTLAGVCLMFSRFMWYRVRVAAVMHEDGSATLGYEEEFFTKWAAYKFNEWTEKYVKEETDH